jgi:hypothetical protein
MCCVLAGCDYFKLRGVALETALKLFRQTLGVPLPADTVAQYVFDELLKMGKLKKDDMEAIISDYLLADACFQLQLVVDIRLLAQRPAPEQLFVFSMRLEALPEKQQNLVRENMAKLVRVRPAQLGCTEHDIAVGRASAATWQLFPMVCAAAVAAAVLFERNIFLEANPRAHTAARKQTDERGDFPLLSLSLSLSLLFVSYSL